MRTTYVKQRIAAMPHENYSQSQALRINRLHVCNEHHQIRKAVQSPYLIFEAPSVKGTLYV